MITLKNVKTLGGTATTHTIESRQTQEIDCGGRLLMIPAFIDTDAPMGPVSGTPGEMTAWANRAKSYLAAGITTVFDSEPQTTGHVQSIKRQILESLKSSHIPLHVNLYCDGNRPEDFDSIGKVKAQVSGLKISLDLAKKPIAPPHTSSFERIFQIAAQENLVVTVALIQGMGTVADQRKAAHSAVEKTIAAAEKYSAELCLQHVRTKEELNLIKDAKKRGLLVYAEAAFGHLIANSNDFPKDLKLNNVTVFLPTPEDQHALWQGIKEDSIDLVGSAGVYTPPGLMMPFLFDAWKQKKFPMDELIAVTRVNPEAIFRIPPNSDIVLVDTETEKAIPDDILAAHPLLAPWKGKKMIGWPSHVIVGGEVF